MNNQTLLYLFLLLFFISCQKETSKLDYDYEVNFVKLTNQKEIDAYGLEIEKYHRIKVIKEFEIVGDSIFTLAPLNNKIKYARLLNISRTSLRNFVGLDSIESVNSVNILDNRFLENLNGLKKIEKIEGLILTNNERLENHEGLESLKNVDRITLRRNDNLYSLDGIESVEGNNDNGKVKFKAYNNALLWDYCALSTLISIDKLDLIVYENFYNPKLEYLEDNRCRIIEF